MSTSTPTQPQTTAAPGTQPPPQPIMATPEQALEFLAALLPSVAIPVPFNQVHQALVIIKGGLDEREAFRALIEGAPGKAGKDSKAGKATPPRGQRKRK